MTDDDGDVNDHDQKEAQFYQDEADRAIRHLSDGRRICNECSTVYAPALSNRTPGECPECGSDDTISEADLLAEP